MPKLGDYLGQLLSEIAMARMQADLETVRLAELYAAHPLLRTLPVPHVRLPEVELDVPILIDESEEPRSGESPRGGVVLEDVGKRFEEVLTRNLEKHGVTLTAAERRRLKSASDARLAAFRSQPETAIDVNRLADDLTTGSIETVRSFKPRGGESEVISDKAAAELRLEVRAEILRLRSEPPRLSVSVTSSVLREAGTTSNLTRIRLKVAEHGVEWTTIESDGTSEDRLVPE